MDEKCERCNQILSVPYREKICRRCKSTGGSPRELITDGSARERTKGLIQKGS